MGDTLTIRLAERDRAILEEAARSEGTGLSAFIRALAEKEARRLSRAAILAESERIVSYLKTDPGARAELESMGTPIGELP